VASVVAALLCESLSACPLDRLGIERRTLTSVELFECSIHISSKGPEAPLTFHKEAETVGNDSLFRRVPSAGKLFLHELREFWGYGIRHDPTHSLESPPINGNYY